MSFLRLSTPEERNSSLISNPYSPKTYLLIIVLTASVHIVALLALYFCDQAGSDTCGKNAFPAAIWGELKEPDWCENASNVSLIGELSNSLSNFAYIYFGVLILIFGIGDKLYEAKNNPAASSTSEQKPRDQVDATENEDAPQNYFLSWPLLSEIYGLTNIYLGVGSFLFHAHTSDTTFFFDETGIFVNLFFACMYFSVVFVPLSSPNSNRATVIKILLFIAVTIISMTLCALGMVDLNAFFGLIFASIALSSFLAILYVSLQLRKRKKLDFGYEESKSSIFRCEKHHDWGFKLGLVICPSFMVFLCVFAFWFMQEQEDVVHFKCDGDSWLQRHAAWHVLTAMAFAILYFFLRSEYRVYNKASININGEDI